MLYEVITPGDLGGVNGFADDFCAVGADAEGVAVVPRGQRRQHDGFGDSGIPEHRHQRGSGGGLADDITGFSYNFV